MNKALGYTTAAILGAVGIGWYIYGDELITKGDLLYTPNEPKAVANDFWITALDKDDSAATKYLSKSDYSAPLIPGYSEHDRAVMGKSEQDNGVYFIKTTLTLHRNGAYSQIPLFTVVVSVDGKFKVDLQNTLASVEDAALENALAYYANAAEASSSLLSLQPLSDEERTRLLETSLENFEMRMCDARIKIIEAVKPGSGQTLIPASYCR